MSELPENAGIKQEMRNEKGQFVPGVSGHPEGKPKGAKNKFSFVNYWQERWTKNPEEFNDLATAFMNDPKLRGLIVQMIDGKPPQDLNLGSTELPFIIQIIKDDGKTGNKEG